LRHKRERERELVVYIKAQQEHQEPLYRSQPKAAETRLFCPVAFSVITGEQEHGESTKKKKKEKRRKKREKKKSKG
jgi:hypothetical protein